MDTFPHAVSGRRRAISQAAADGSAETCRRLASLPFPVFARIAASLLERLGYEDVRLAERLLAGARRNRDGGCDLFARTPDGRRAIVQLKRYAPGYRIHRRQLDEIVGAAVRARVGEALLVTTSALAADLEERLTDRPACPGLPRVRVVAGDELARLARRHGLAGVAAFTAAGRGLPPKVPATDATVRPVRPPFVHLRITLGIEADDASLEES